MTTEYLRIPNELIDNIKKNTVPICFHCGQNYDRDILHSDKDYNTWKPSCKCITTTTIRIMTGPAS